MMARIIFLVFFFGIFHCLYAQTTDKPVIAETIDKGDYYYIPRSAVADSIQAVCHQLKINRTTNLNKRPIEFYWISTCNDGYYNLTITPEQIFFSSSHDNPNPNFLFWVIDIDSLQFRQINKGIQQEPPIGFDNLSKNYGQSMFVFHDSKFKDKFRITGEWTDSIMQQRETYCKIQIKNRLEKYLSIINSYISGPANKVLLPLHEMKPKYFGYSKNEIVDWLPIEFDLPKTKDH